MTALEEYNFNLLQIQIASLGCISGELKEWPALIRAMDYFGFKVSRRISVLIVKDLCSLIYPKILSGEIQ